MNELIKIETEASNFIKDLPLKTVEYRGVRVINAYDIARLHEKEVRSINQQFERVREKLCQNVDYFLVSREELLKSPSVILPPNMKDRLLRQFHKRWRTSPTLGRLTLH